MIKNLQALLNSNIKSTNRTFIPLTGSQVPTMHLKMQVSVNKLEKSTRQTYSRVRKHQVWDNAFLWMDSKTQLLYNEGYKQCRIINRKRDTGM